MHLKLTASFIILNACHLTRTLAKSAYPKNNFLISHPKHMLWVLNYLSIKLLVHYQVQISFNQTTCPLSSATIFQSYYLSTIFQSYYLSTIFQSYYLSTIFQSYYLSTIECNYQSYYLSTIKCNYLSFILLVNYQVQLSFSHTTCPLSNAKSSQNNLFHWYTMYTARKST